MPAKKILLICLDNLGDLTFSSFMPRLLKQKFPQAQVYLLCKKYTEEVGKAIPALDGLWALDPFWGKSPVHSKGPVWPWCTLLLQLRKERFSHCVVLSPNTVASWLAKLAGIKFRVSYRKLGVKKFLSFEDVAVERGDPFEPRTKSLSRLLAPFDIEVKAYTYELFPVWELKLGKDIPQRSLILHPFAGSLARCLPLPYWLDLARQLFARGYTVVWMSSPRETEKHREQLSSIEGSLILSEIQPSIRDYMAYALASDLMIGHDSGPSHIAAALGVPTISFYPRLNMERTPVMGRGLSKMVDIESVDSSAALLSFVTTYLDSLPRKAP